MKSLNLMKPVLLCFSAFMLHALEGQGKGYYVSAAAGDGGDGTHVRPFKDIQAAATLAEAGNPGIPVAKAVLSYFALCRERARW